MTDLINSPENSSTKKIRKTKTLYKYPVVVIIWDDAETAGGWEEIPEEIKPAIATSMGFLIKESDDHVLIASSYDERHVNGRLQIPRGMIKQITYLVKNERKKP